MSKQTQEGAWAVLEQYIPAPLLAAAKAKGFTVEIVPDMTLESMYAISPATREFVDTNFSDNKHEAFEHYARENDTKSVSGRYIHQDKILAIRETADPYTIVHEFGHFVDHEMLPGTTEPFAGLIALTIDDEGKVESIGGSEPWARTWSEDQVFRMVRESVGTKKLDEIADYMEERLDTVGDDEDPSDEDIKLLSPIFPTDYALTNPQEFFAESFALWLRAERWIVRRAWSNPDAIPAELIAVFENLPEYKAQEVAA